MATPAQRVLVLTLVTGVSGAIYLLAPDSPLACVPLVALGLRALVFSGATYGFGVARRGYHELAFQAERDLLTGLANRRGLENAARRELGSARRGRRPLSVAFLDLDDFKHVNDELGHAEGDRLLATIGAVLGRGRRSDVVARLGGDELVVLMPDTDDMAARAAIERLRHSAAAAIVRAGFHVTFTTGLARSRACPARWRPSCARSTVCSTRASAGARTRSARRPFPT
jgi:diguanylate cyclase (GGDEF)-like protein